MMRMILLFLGLCLSVSTTLAQTSAVDSVGSKSGGQESGTGTLSTGTSSGTGPAPTIRTGKGPTTVNGTNLSGGMGLGAGNNLPNRAGGSGNDNYNTVNNGRRNSGTEEVPSAPLWSEKGICPFRSNNTEVLQAWNEAKTRLTGLTTKDQTCSAALESFRQSLGNQQLVSDALIDPILSAQAQADEVDRRILYLQSTTGGADGCASMPTSTTITAVSNDALVDTGSADSLGSASSTQVTIQRTCNELDSLIARKSSLEATISQARGDRNAAQQNQARTQTFNQVKGAIDSIPSLASACEHAEGNVLGTIGSASLNLFATAQPLIMGANAGVSAVASILSSIVGAFRGKSTAEKAADFMQSAGDLRNLSCFYFAVMRLQCSLSRGPAAETHGSDVEVLEDIRQLFESERNGALGKKMRSLFQSTFSGDLGPEKTRRIPQYCAMMTNIPGRNDRCNQTARVGTPMSDCTYVDYFERGTNLPGFRGTFPTAVPSGPLSQPRSTR